MPLAALTRQILFLEAVHGTLAARRTPPSARIAPGVLVQRYELPAEHARNTGEGPDLVMYRLRINDRTVAKTEMIRRSPFSGTVYEYTAEQVARRLLETAQRRISADRATVARWDAMQEIGPC